MARCGLAVAQALALARPDGASALRLWRQITDAEIRARPDGITVAETVASLERSNRTEDADHVFAEALEMRVPLKTSRSVPGGAPRGLEGDGSAWTGCRGVRFRRGVMGVMGVLGGIGFSA